MGYTKNGFVDGQNLPASKLIRMEDAIINNETAIGTVAGKVGAFDAAEWICTQTEQQSSEPQNLANFTSSNTYYSPLDVTYSGTGISTANSTGANKTVQINLNGMNLVEGTSYKMKFVNTNYTLSGIMASSTVISTETTEGGYTVLTWTHQAGVILSMLHPYNKSEASLTGITITPASASSGGGSQEVLSENPYLNPEKVKGLGFDSLGGALKDAVGGYNPTTYKGDEIRVFDSIVCIGDSMTAGVFNKETPGEYATIAKYSYPAYLGKMTGCYVTNEGVGGLTAGGWYNQCGTLSGHDCAIIMLGINDAIQGTATATFTTALGNIVDQLQLDSPGIKIFVATTPPATAYADSRYIPINAAIRTFVSGRNDCYLVDLQEYGHTADEEAYNKGHLSALGYRRLAEDFKNYISYIISQNLDDFDEVQFANSYVDEHIS